MYLAMNHIVAGAAGAASLEGRFGARARLVDEMPGFRSFELLRPLPGPAHGARRNDAHLVLTRWDDRTAFETWASGPVSREGHRRPAAGAPRRRRPAAGRPADAGHVLADHPRDVRDGLRPGLGGPAAAAAAPVMMMNVIDVAAPQAAHFQEVFRSREGGVEGEPGFLALEVLRPVVGRWEGPPEGPPEGPHRRGRPEGPPEGEAEAGDGEAVTFVVCSRWESAAAHEAWTHSEAFRQAHGRRRLGADAVLRAGVCAFQILFPAYAGAGARAAARRLRLPAETQEGKEKTPVSARARTLPPPAAADAPRRRLTAAERAAYARDGYAVVPAVFPAAVRPAASARPAQHGQVPVRRGGVVPVHLLEHGAGRRPAARRDARLNQRAHGVPVRVLAGREPQGRPGDVLHLALLRAPVPGDAGRPGGEGPPGQGAHERGGAGQVLLRIGIQPARRGVGAERQGDHGDGARGAGGARHSDDSFRRLRGRIGG